MRVLRYSIMIGVVMCLNYWVPLSEAGPDHGPARKFGRGVANVMTGPLEIPFQIMNVSEQSGHFAGVFVGTGKGLLYFVRRSLTGIVEVATFPIPNPGPDRGYGPIIEPEFVRFRNADRW